MDLKKISIGLIIIVIFVGCVSAPQPLVDRNSALSQGNIQMNLVVGQTRKSDVIENFGSPNITTRDGASREVWTYQRQAQVTKSSSKSGYWTVILGGQSNATAGFESSSRMITLIIKFDEQDIVTDFRSRASNF